MNKSVVGVVYWVGILTKWYLYRVSEELPETVRFTVAATGEHGSKSTATTSVIFRDCREKIQVRNVFFRLYPNPAQVELTVELFASQREKVSLKLVDPEGKTILETSGIDVEGLTISTLDLTGIAKGAYLLSVQYAGETAVQKIIIN